MEQSAPSKNNFLMNKIVAFCQFSEKLNKKCFTNYETILIISENCFSEFKNEHNKGLLL